MKKIGILGGTRFIGYHLAQTLLNAGHQVTLFHRGQTAPPQPFSPPPIYIYGDRNIPSDIGNFFRASYDALIDLSGYFPQHVQPLLTKDRRSKIGHYIFCSTSSVYETPPPCPFAETAPRTTNANTYGGGKALIEDLLLETWHRERLPVTILRPQGVFGPFGPAQAAFVFSRLQNSLPILLGRRRGYKTNFLYIHDLVAAFMGLMNQPISYGKIYNVAGDEIVTQLDFSRLCSEVSSLDLQIRIIDDAKYKHVPIGIPWLNYDLLADNSQIKKDLKLLFTPLKTALAETWAWLQMTPENLRIKPFRGEKYLRANRPIPIWVNACWRIDDMTRSFPARKWVIPRLIRLCQQSQRIRNLWRRYQKAKAKT